jgi:hypothetical protein
MGSNGNSFLEGRYMNSERLNCPEPARYFKLHDSSGTHQKVQYTGVALVITRSSAAHAARKYLGRENMPLDTTQARRQQQKGA